MAFLSKINVGGQVYDLKDAQSRADLATLLGEHALAALGGADAKERCHHRTRGVGTARL